MRGKNSFECIFIFCRIQFENLQNNYKCFFLHRDPLSLSHTHTCTRPRTHTHAQAHGHARTHAHTHTHMHEHMDMHTRSHLRMHKHALHLCWHKFDACWWHHQFCKTWCGSKTGLDKRLRLKWLNEHRWQWGVEGSNPIDCGDESRNFLEPHETCIFSFQYTRCVLIPLLM